MSVESEMENFKILFNSHFLCLDTQGDLKNFSTFASDSVHEKPLKFRLWFFSMFIKRDF